MSNSHINEYRHQNGVDTLGAEVGSELDKVLAKDSDYELAGKGSPAAPEAPAEEETETTEEDGEGQSAEEVELKSLSRDELNKLAADRGIENPGDLPNKGEVIAAIEKAPEAPAEEG